MHQNIGDGYLGTQALARLINHPSLAHLPLILEVPGDGSGPDKANIDRVKQMFS
ncbi:MAG: putative endonuclease 4 [Microgenomates group bacterium GW2011_GWA1_46_7]|nr:MAG: putative endonuclease 4 [Microgenomates group bacterium GW2011_GWA1_46_7]